MGLPVTVYRNTDAGAPAIPTKPSGWITVLKKCLVEGYGEKQPLGWTLDFEDAANNKVVFKNNVADGGSGGAVQFQPHTGSDAINAALRITCANSITAIDAFFKKVGYRVMMTSNSLGTVRGWMVVGTSKGFWLIQESGETLNNSSTTSVLAYREYFFIGDIESFVPNDMGIFTLLTCGDPTLDSADTGYALNIGSSQNIPRCALYEANGGSTIFGYSTDWQPDFGWAYQGNVIDPQQIGVPVNLVKVSIIHSSFGLVTNPACRGTIPGLFKTQFSGYKDAVLPVIRTFEGIDYLLVTGMQKANAFISLGGEWYV
ncbi:hypothetical protein [Shewanella baltica]|uniref:hypothetical protein n=1 Tax=Shewanella baltica TaxID=62322 RepID=UPI00014F8DDC|nr:hypothetical protein [Shewanella baltica]ABS06925.1 conserved hypothetical protein [Shewanella baltica OS185]